MGAFTQIRDTIGVLRLVSGFPDRSGRPRFAHPAHSSRSLASSGRVKKAESFEGELHRELRKEVGLDGAKVGRVLDHNNSLRKGKDNPILGYVLSTEPSAVEQVRAADLAKIEQIRWLENCSSSLTMYRPRRRAGG